MNDAPSRYTWTMKLRSERGRQGVRRVALAAVLVAIAASCGVLSGCAKPLLSPREPRSQYSRYDLVRNQYSPQYLEDEFGRRIPNLRGRLLEQQ